MNIKEFKERKNTHQTHLEDLVLLGKDGIEELNDKIDKFIARIGGDKSGSNLTTKIDGAPAVVCWSEFTDYPANSICLKSFVTSNKNCLSSEEDIEAKYGAEYAYTNIFGDCYSIVERDIEKEQKQNAIKDEYKKILAK